MEAGRRGWWVLGALCLAACGSPTEGSELPPFSTSAPSTTELLDIADRDPLPFPGFDVDRVTIAPLPGAARPEGTAEPLTGWAAFDAELARQILGGGGSDAMSVSVAIGGEVVHEAAFGARVPDSFDVVDVDDEFRIASISKSITAIVALQLVEDGLVGLDEPVGARVAAAVGVADPGRAGDITIRQLLHHTSGFPQYESLFFRDQVGSCEEAAAVGLAGSIGGGFRYSNMNYCVLGLLIEQVTGQDYESAVYQRLLTPLGVSGMRLAPTYDPGPGEVEHRSVPGRNYMEVLAGAGAWVATPTDLVTIFDSLDHSTPGFKPLAPETVAMMLQTPAGGDRGYGMGVILYGGGTFGHTGTIESTHAMVFDRADDVTWAVTVSGEHPSDTPRLAGMVDRSLVAGGFVTG